MIPVLELVSMLVLVLVLVLVVLIVKQKWRLVMEAKNRKMDLKIRRSIGTIRVKRGDRDMQK